MLPPGMQTESLPAASNVERGATVYQSSAEKAEKQGNALHFKRSVKMAAYYVPPDWYQALRQFYEQIRSGEEQQVVLKTGQSLDNPPGEAHPR